MSVRIMSWLSCFVHVLNLMALQDHFFILELKLFFMKQCSPFITLNLGSIGIDMIKVNWTLTKEMLRISKLTISLSFMYHSLVKFYVKILEP